MVDEILKEMSPQFAKLYSGVGRPSIAPERLFRSLLLQIFYSVRSERTVSYTHLDVYKRQLDRNAGLSLLADIDMHAVSDGDTLTTSGAARIQDLKVNKGATVKPIDLAYRGTYRLRENSGHIEGLTAKIGYAVVHADGTYQVCLLYTSRCV